MQYKKAGKRFHKVRAICNLKTPGEGFRMLGARCNEIMVQNRLNKKLVKRNVK